jgi:phenylalanyl-tRNA synthetase alpha chain
MDLLDKIQNLEKEFQTAITAVNSSEELEKLRITFLGRKGSITHLFKDLGSEPLEVRKEAGQKINALKKIVQDSIESKKDLFRETTPAAVRYDPTLPGDKWPVGRYHPLTVTLREITACFHRMGFSVAQGPEVESDYYNFEALNIPKGHPARDMHDTFYLGDETVLRTHTSPVQVRVMENQPPPVRIIAPGVCFRRDTPDSTHSPVFHQVEGLCVDEGITFADLKGTLLTFARSLLGSDIKIRFRPSFFPFTEPSAEYDFLCIMCKGKGCKLCKGTGWIEISGAGMVNPAVFEFVDYDPERYTGYAFGMGVERIAMILYAINDIRLFQENDIRFLKQF